MKSNKKHTVLPSDLGKDDAILVRLFYSLHGNYKKIAFALNKIYKEAGTGADGVYYTNSVVNSRLGRLRKLGIPLYIKRAGGRWKYPMEDAHRKSEELGSFVLAESTTLNAIVERLVKIATDFLTEGMLPERYAGKENAEQTNGMTVSTGTGGYIASPTDADLHSPDAWKYITSPHTGDVPPINAQEQANLFAAIDKGSPRDAEILNRLKVANTQVSSTINMLAMQSLMLEEVIDILER